MRDRELRESQWPGSGLRDKIFRQTLVGVLDAMTRNIVSITKRAEELSKWSDEHLEAGASNHTLIVEAIFSHMRRLEDNSHVTRGPLMC